MLLSFSFILNPTCCSIFAMFYHEKKCSPEVGQVDHEAGTEPMTALYLSRAVDRPLIRCVDTLNCGCMFRRERDQVEFSGRPDAVTQTVMRRDYGHHQRCCKSHTTARNEISSCELRSGVKYLISILSSPLNQSSQSPTTLRRRMS